ncbi:MAG: (5-formylfuran-3-yl)methyl phosphate synthase [Nitrososphaerota archaeon]|nr:(5-formylfuran-3-yl)methyl phosphate synthase [Nitrososphaerales archaeon]MCX8191492.1 (5-formylfuran-3-yl)methyl phosphate synthase [Nitrososphaerales archaeon]MDW8045015.1 (5-formylfuran-3-yl)methyl phosphate synthase [Nitrososphaerota archaeon]
MKVLVSVVNLKEAMDALNADVDIIDVKNPSEGALGANFPWVLSEIQRYVGGRAEVSATIGDLPYLPGTASLAALGAASCGVDYVKVGLFGPKNPKEASRMIKTISKSLKGYKSKVIAAGYADYFKYGCVNPLELPQYVANADGAGILIDVKEKNENGLFHYFTTDRLKRFVREAHEYGLTVALAGHLGIGDVAKVYEVGADIIGVRRSVCKIVNNGRVRLDKDLVKELIDVVRRFS